MRYPCSAGDGGCCFVVPGSGGSRRQENAGARRPTSTLPILSMTRRPSDFVVCGAFVEGAVAAVWLWRHLCSIRSSKPARCSRAHRSRRTTSSRVRFMCSTSAHRMTRRSHSPSSRSTDTFANGFDLIEVAQTKTGFRWVSRAERKRISADGGQRCVRLRRHDRGRWRCRHRQEELCAPIDHRYGIRGTPKLRSRSLRMSVRLRRHAFQRIGDYIAARSPTGGILEARVAVSDEMVGTRNCLGGSSLGGVRRGRRSSARSGGRRCADLGRSCP